jgi:hypothetical protein
MNFAIAVTFLVIAGMILVPLRINLYFNYESKGDSIFETEIKYLKKYWIPYLVAIICIGVAALFEFI